jgi:hypothetical protein
LWDVVSNTNIRLFQQADTKLAKARDEQQQQQVDNTAASQSFRDLYVAQMADYFGAELVRFTF